MDVMFPEGLYRYEEFSGYVCWESGHMFWSTIKPGDTGMGKEVTTAWGRYECDYELQRMTVTVEDSNDPGLIGACLTFGSEWLDVEKHRNRYWQILPDGGIGRTGVVAKI